MSPFLVDDCLCLSAKPIGVSAYDFDFRTFFPCRSLWQARKNQSLILRHGALDDYDQLFSDYQDKGFRLIHTPGEHRRASLLSHWYPLIKEWTPKSHCFDGVPSAEQILKEFECPVFIKGDRQTAGHREDLCVARSPSELEALLARYRESAILHWQNLICREFVSLQAVSGDTKGKVRASFEFRTFWWRQRFVGAGHYWSEFTSYSWSDSEREDALALGQRVAERLALPFLVIDLAKTVEQQWIVIECNDGQESGYAGLSPFLLWQNILEEERRLVAQCPSSKDV